MEDSFLTVAEIAELLKLNQQTVRNWIDAGDLAAVPVGRRVRVRQSELDRFIAAGETASQTRNAGAAKTSEDTRRRSNVNACAMRSPRRLPRLRVTTSSSSTR